MSNSNKLSIKKVGWHLLTGRVNKPGQLLGEEAYRALQEKVSGKHVRLDVIDIDRYQRMMSIVWLNNRNVNKETVAEGLAWAYRRYLDRPYASEHIDAVKQARAKQLGLWQQNNPQPPWEFRKTLRIRSSVN